MRRFTTTDKAPLVNFKKEVILAKQHNKSLHDLEGVFIVTKKSGGFEEIRLADADALKKVLPIKKDDGIHDGWIFCQTKKDYDEFMARCNPSAVGVTNEANVSDQARFR